MADLTPKQRHILRHALGLDNPAARGKSYRNRYIVGEKSDGYADCEKLVELGLMEKYDARSELTGGDDCFCVTSEGEKIARES